MVNLAAVPLTPHVEPRAPHVCPWRSHSPLPQFLSKRENCSDQKAQPYVSCCTSFLTLDSFKMKLKEFQLYTEYRLKMRADMTGTFTGQSLKRSGCPLREHQIRPTAVRVMRPSLACPANTFLYHPTPSFP